MKVLVFGASGFIGSALVPFLESQGYLVYSISRHASDKKLAWNPEKKELPLSLLEDTDVIINLSGENIFGRWTQKKKQAIENSRILSAEFLTETLLSLKKPPKIYLGASAIGYYGDRGDEILTETSSSGIGFLPTLCQRLEHIPKKLKTRNTRVIALRLGIVLGKEGGAYKKMITPFQLGLGATLGDGKQIMSWISLDDVLFAILYIIQNALITGSVNLTSPYPVTNFEFTKLLGKVLKRPTLFRVPKWILKLGMGDAANVLLSSACVYPEILKEAGFVFRYPLLEEALLHITKEIK